MRMYLKIENNVIVDVKFLTFGCGAAIATSSMATDLIKGKTIDEALKLTNKAVVEALEGLPPIKVHCSVLAGAQLLFLDGEGKHPLGKAVPGGAGGACSQIGIQTPFQPAGGGIAPQLHDGQATGWRSLTMGFPSGLTPTVTITRKGLRRLRPRSSVIWPKPFGSLA